VGVASGIDLPEAIMTGEAVNGRELADIDY
jgi:hypothetical protein